jgi:hypothetical protein
MVVLELELLSISEKNRNFEYERIDIETSFEFITLKFKNKKAFHVISVYRPSDSSVSTNNWNEFWIFSHVLRVLNI